jgi:phosphatidylserine decarboxylase
MEGKTKKITKKVTNINKKIKIHKEGKAILISLFVLLIGVNCIFHFWNPSGVGVTINLFFSLVIFVFFLFFFRNTVRILNNEDDAFIVAPADGRIVAIETENEYEYLGGKKMMQRSLFMSVFSVHANWYPVNGIVKYTKHHNGKHLVAYLPKSSHENERSATVIETKNGQQILVRQIAGALARRIVTYASEGHIASINSHLGFIKFGSRVDLILPVETKIFVSLNESTKANQTIIARLHD